MKIEESPLLAFSCKMTSDVGNVGHENNGLEWNALFFFC